MEEKERKVKKNTGLKVTIVVLAILVIALGGFIAYDKFIAKDSIKTEESKKEGNNEDTEEKEKSETVDINSTLVQNLYGIFRLDKSCYINIDNLNNNNLVKLRLAYENISKQNIESIECSKLELSDSAYCGSMNGLMIEAHGAGNMTKFREYEKQNYTDSISANLIEAKVHELFGNDYEVKHESFGTGHVIEATCYFMKYDTNNSLYAQFNCEGGGTCALYHQELVSASKKGDKLYIVTTLKDPEGNNPKTVTYTFKTDKLNNNYAFEKVDEG